MGAKSEFICFYEYEAGGRGVFEQYQKKIEPFFLISFGHIFGYTDYKIGFIDIFFFQ